MSDDPLISLPAVARWYPLPAKPGKTPWMPKATPPHGGTIRAEERSSFFKSASSARY